MAKQEASVVELKPAPSDHLGPRVPVKELIFREATSVPGSHGSVITTGGLRTMKRWEIDYLPRVGLHEIRFFEASSDVPMVRYVPREWAQFVAL